MGTSNSGISDMLLELCVTELEDVATNTDASRYEINTRYTVIDFTYSYSYFTVLCSILRLWQKVVIYRVSQKKPLFVFCTLKLDKKG